MAQNYRQIMMTPAVLEAQRAAYGRASAPPRAEGADALGPMERAFIAERDSFYMATVNEDGRPYVQHRGGPPGFVRALDERTIAFGDLGGNRQLLSLGNLAKNDAVALFLMDYPGRTRLKIAGRARIVLSADADREEVRVRDLFASSDVERVWIIRVDGFDWNCPQHITPRYTEAEIEDLVRPLQKRIEELEATVRRLSGERARG